jgi:hypothetical protein
MSFIYQWLFGIKPQNREEEDRKYRLQVSETIRAFLLRLKDDGVIYRESLKHYIGYFVYGTKIDCPEKAYIQEILIKVGWLPLDPYYSDDETWLDAKLILTDSSINLAVDRLAEPYNRNWCYCLAEDFVRAEDL